MIGGESEDSMPEHETIPRLPTSGQIIGALAKRLRIRHPVLQKRTTREYFAGNTERLVKDATRAEIIGAIVEVLTASGLVTSPQVGENDDKLAPALDAVLQWHADEWDLLRSFLRPRMARVLPSHLPKVWAAYLRLAVIDLALRVAAHLHLAGSSPSTLNLLDSVSISSRGDYLNRKRQQAQLSLESLAEAVEVTDNAVDSWMYRGARPSDDNLLKIAKALADRIAGSSAAGIALELRALYWISEVAALLAEHIGDEAVDEVIGRLHWYAEETYRTVDEQFPVANRTADLTVLADLGVGTRIAEPLLSGLIEREPDDEWRKDLRSTGMDWVRRVLSINQDINLAEVDDLIQRTEGRLLEEWDVSNPEAYAHYRRSLELQVQGKLYEALAEVEIAARLDPLDPANHFTLGSVKGGLGAERGDMTMVNEGIEACWLAVTLDPQWALPWTEIGLILLRIGRAAEAVEHLQRIKPDCGPLDNRYYSTLGTAHWRLGALPEALSAYEKAVEQDPEDTSDLLAASEIALQLGDSAKHRRFARMARHFGADCDTEALLESLREFRQERPDDADAVEHDRKIAVMDAVIRLSPDDDYAHLTRGLAHFAKGDDDLAIADLDAVLRLDPDHAAAYMLRGILYGNNGQWDRMMADMSELIRLKPDDARAYYQRGQGYGEQDMLDQALTDLNEAIRLDPDHADAYRVRGDCLRYKGKYDEAIADFGTALRLDPENTAAYLGRGAAYRMKGDLAQAIADYNDAVRLKPAEPLAYRFRGDARVARGDYGLAITDCNMALKLGPHDPIAYFTRGNAHLFGGKLETALADFNSAIELDPTSGRYTYGRGLVHYLMGDEDSAEEDFQRARELGYDDQDPE